MGEDIDVWRDSWLPRGATRQPRTPSSYVEDEDELKVAELKDPKSQLED
jgi:hypothetical protein